MPLVWDSCLAQIQLSTPTPVPGLTVSANHMDALDEIVTYDQGVIAKYDVEILTAEHLELHPKLRYGLARGAVHLIDPDGTLDADDALFSWEPEKRYILASNVLVKIAGAEIRARHADLRNGRWTLTDFYFTTDRLRPPLYSITGSSIIIYPGRYATIKSPELSIFGQRVYGLPEETINLDPRATGFRPPNPELRGGAGIGMNWMSGFLIDKSSTIELHADSYPGSRPGDGLVLTRSFTDPNLATRIIEPRSEFGQRFSYGYFESVLVSAPEGEAGYMGEKRSSLSFESSQNNGVSARGATDENFTLPAAVEYEQGGQSHGFELLNEFRLEQIDAVSGKGVARGVASSSVDLPAVHLGKSFEYITRLDASAFMSDHGFGWAKITSGLVYKPVSWLQFGLGGTAAFQTGRPDFDIDPLYALNGIAARMDYVLGPRKFSVMDRYDAHLGWYDQEYTFTQAMGSLEAFYIYRRYPGDSRYGIMLRLDSIENLLKRRQFRSPGAGIGAPTDSP
jgi:hypothetical protein